MSGIEKEICSVPDSLSSLGSSIDIDRIHIKAEVEIKAKAAAKAEVAAKIKAEARELPLRKARHTVLGFNREVLSCEQNPTEYETFLKQFTQRFKELEEIKPKVISDFNWDLNDLYQNLKRLHDNFPKLSEDSSGQRENFISELKKIMNGIVLLKGAKINITSGSTFFSDKKKKRDADIIRIQKKTENMEKSQWKDIYNDLTEFIGAIGSSGRKIYNSGEDFDKEIGEICKIINDKIQGNLDKITQEELTEIKSKLHMVDALVRNQLIRITEPKEKKIETTDRIVKEEPVKLTDAEIRAYEKGLKAVNQLIPKIESVQVEVESIYRFEEPDIIENYFPAT